MTLLRHLYIDAFITVLCFVYKATSPAVGTHRIYRLCWHRPELHTECNMNTLL